MDKWMLCKNGILLVVIVVTMLGACSSSIEINYFSLGDYAKSAEGKPRELTIAVENFRSPPMIRRNEIIIRKGREQQLTISSSDFWWALPEEMVTEYLKNYLIEKKRFQIMDYPSTHSVDYLIEGIVKQFEVYANGNKWQVKIALRILVIEHKQDKIIWDSGILRMQTPCAANMQSAATTMGKSLQKLLAILETKLEALSKG